MRVSKRKLNNKNVNANDRFVYLYIIVILGWFFLTFEDLIAREYFSFAFSQIFLCLFSMLLN